jgi:selenocysteine lyase/cysteine desulfurase
LEEIEGVRLYGAPPGAARTPTIAFTINEVPSTEVAKNLAEHGIFLSHGDFYALTVVERLGLAPDGLVRAGCACYTVPEEIDRLLGAVGEL